MEREEVTRMDRFRRESIRGTVQGRCHGDKCREAEGDGLDTMRDSDCDRFFFKKHSNTRQHSYTISTFQKTLTKK